jgi:hypothetical protein
MPSFAPTASPVSAAHRWATEAKLGDSFPITRAALTHPNASVRVVNFLQLNDLVGRVTFERTDGRLWRLTAASACALPTPEPPPHLTTLDEATAWVRARFPWVTAVIQSPRPVDGHPVFEVSADTLAQRDSLQAVIDHYQLNDVLIVQDTGLG